MRCTCDARIRNGKAFYGSRGSSGTYAAPLFSISHQPRDHAMSA